jgi:hypothetical protein
VQTLTPPAVDKELAWTFVLAARRYWREVFPRTRLELRDWRRRAGAIPDARLRGLGNKNGKDVYDANRLVILATGALGATIGTARTLRRDYSSTGLFTTDFYRQSANADEDMCADPRSRPGLGAPMLRWPAIRADTLWHAVKP